MISWLWGVVMQFFQIPAKPLTDKQVEERREITARKIAQILIIRDGDL